MTDFPVLDSTRTDANAELSRTVIAEVGAIELHIDETDSWITMPIRISRNDAAGIVFELGPYDLDRRDVVRLREALRRYDVVCNGPSIRRVR